MDPWLTELVALEILKDRRRKSAHNYLLAQTSPRPRVANQMVRQIVASVGNLLAARWGA
jgi:hypothetical protein